MGQAILLKDGNAVKNLIRLVSGGTAVPESVAVEGTDPEVAQNCEWRGSHDLVVLQRCTEALRNFSRIGKGRYHLYRCGIARELQALMERTQDFTVVQMAAGVVINLVLHGDDLGELHQRALG